MALLKIATAADTGEADFMTNEAIRGLLLSMRNAQLRAMLLYTRLVAGNEHDAAGS